MKNMQHGSWIRLAIMTVASFVAMYVLMYMMVDRLANVLPNVNQLYMALSMTAAMVAIEVVVMKRMYPGRALVATVLVGSILIGAISFTFVRRQIGVGDTQFLKSMIPHHAAAILMCKEADLTDPQVVELCQGIVSGQQAEIDFMQQKLDEPR